MVRPVHWLLSGPGITATITFGTIPLRLNSRKAKQGELVETANFDHILKTLNERKPYRPFAVALVNGDRFEVDHPDALVVRDGVAVYIGAGGVPVLFDHEGVGQFIGDLMDQSDT